MRICKLDIANHIYGAGGPSMGFSIASTPSPSALAGNGGSVQTFSSSGGGGGSNDGANSASASIGQWAHDNPSTVGAGVTAVTFGACQAATGYVATNGCGLVAGTAGAAAADAAARSNPDNSGASDNTSCNNISGGAPGACGPSN